jgi:3-deoxy-D-manno-octulosonic acid kinase
MDLVIRNYASISMASDASCLQSPSVEYFSVDYWQDQGVVEGLAPGRGHAWFIKAPFGRAVLRRYLRGGWAARLSRDRYLFTSVERSRPFREFHLLSRLCEVGLNVPRPLAALCEHHGCLSSGALITERIPQSQTLAERLPMLGDSDWVALGRSLANFHRAGVRHADLNARNILLDGRGQVFLVDFDRARYSPGRGVNGASNLRRLRRSLAKLWPGNAPVPLQVAWGRLLDGYRV